MNRITYLCLLAAALAVLSGCSNKKNLNTYMEMKADDDMSVEAASESINLLFDEVTSEVSSKPEEYPEIETMSESEVKLVPELKWLSFEDAMRYGEAIREKGEFRYSSYGSWYTIRVGDMEYFYVMSEKVPGDGWLGYAIVGSRYALANGITVGMTEEEVCRKYPNVAIMNFDNTYVSEERKNNKGWDTERFPASWTDKFDYVIVANVEHEWNKDYYLYLALLIKDKTVKAITFNNFEVDKIEK